MNSIHQSNITQNGEIASIFQAETGIIVYVQKELMKKYTSNDALICKTDIDAYDVKFALHHEKSICKVNFTHALSGYCLIRSELFAEVAFPELLEGFR